MSLGECMYSCRHPLWGGEGTCITDDGRCECDEGFVTRDSFGSPSCVSKQAISWLYVVMTMTAATLALFFLWHLQRRRHTSETTRRSPKGVIRLRMLISLSLSAAGTTVVATVAMARTGEASLWDGGMFYVYYSFAFPLLMFAGMEVLELWLNYLPPQMIVPGSAIAKIIHDGGKHHLFVRMGAFNGVLVALIGPLSMIFRQRHLISAFNIISLLSAPLTVGAIVMVAVHITKAINKASSQARQAWHAKAKRSIRRQSCAFLVMCTMFTASVGMLELSEIGRRTPIFPFMAMCLGGTAGLAIAVHLSRPTVEKVSSPAVSSKSSLLSLHRSFSEKISPLLSPRALLKKTSTLLSPRGFSGRERTVEAEAACNESGGGATKEDGGDCKESGDVDAATPTVPKASRASNDKLPSFGGLCTKTVPT